MCLGCASQEWRHSFDDGIAQGAHRDGDDTDPSRGELKLDLQAGDGATALTLAPSLMAIRGLHEH